MGLFKSKCLRWKHPSKRNLWLGNGICRDKDGGVETRIWPTTIGICPGKIRQQMKLYITSHGIWRTKNGGYVPWHGVRTQLQMGQSSWGGLGNHCCEKVTKWHDPTGMGYQWTHKRLGILDVNHPFWSFSFCVCLSSVICLSHLSDLSLSNHLQ